jgi:hypothetical protein
MSSRQKSLSSTGRARMEMVYLILYIQRYIYHIEYFKCSNINNKSTAGPRYSRFCYWRYFHGTEPLRLERAACTVLKSRLYSSSQQSIG